MDDCASCAVPHDAYSFDTNQQEHLKRNLKWIFNEFCRENRRLASVAGGGVCVYEQQRVIREREIFILTAWWRWWPTQLSRLQLRRVLLAYYYLGVFHVELLQFLDQATTGAFFFY
jgi:hypothetical protein